MIDHVRNQTAYVLNTTTNKYGDQKEASRTEELVRFRYQTDIDRNTGRESANATQAIIHFRAGASVSEGTIVLVDGKYWRIETLIKARKMDGEVQFLKAFVQKHEI